MNKAFVREPDNTETFCPKCGAAGVPVPWITVEHHVPEETRKRLTASSLFCMTPSCEVAYFDAMESYVLAADLVKPVYPKDAAAPLCPCFGLTKHDVEDDIDAPSPVKIRALLAKSKSPAAHCETASPTGRCCMPEVQKYYFKVKGAGD
jgi:hypothetical protein